MIWAIYYWHICNRIIGITILHRFDSIVCYYSGLRLVPVNAHRP